MRTYTGARVRLISAGGAHAAAVVDPSTGEEKGQQEEEGLKAMYGASPTLSPGASWVLVFGGCSYRILTSQSHTTQMHTVISRVKSASLEAFPVSSGTAL